MTTTSHRFVFALPIVAACLAVAAPAAAQLAGGRSAFDQRRGPEPVQFRDFFGGGGGRSYPNNSYDPFWGDRRSSYPNNSYDPYDPLIGGRRSTNQPRRRRRARWRSRLPRPFWSSAIRSVIGSGMDFEQVFAETPEIGIQRKIKPDLGLARDDARLDAPEWSKAISDMLATEKPDAIVVMLGLNDRLPLRDRVPATKGTTTLLDNDHPPATAAETQHQRPGENHEFQELQLPVFEGGLNLPSLVWPPSRPRDPALFALALFGRP